MDYRRQKMQPQAINEAERLIKDYFISLDAERFSEQAIKKLKFKDDEINLSAKKSIIKAQRRNK